MNEQMTAQIAKVEGLYRCTALGETKFCLAGETLPPCTCSGGGRWELRKEDNIKRADAIPVFVREKGLYIIQTDELPEVGVLLNIRAREEHRIKTGKHRIKFVDADFIWLDKTYFLIEIERVGGLADDLPIHSIKTLFL